MTSIYLASALSEAPGMRQWAMRIVNEIGLSVVSSWHDETFTCDPVDVNVRRDTLENNLRDLRSADVLFIQTTSGEPSCAYVELGYAMARGTRCVWLQPPARRSDGKRFANIADSHRLVRIVTQDADVIPALLRVEMASRDTLTELNGAT